MRGQANASGGRGVGSKVAQQTCDNLLAERGKVERLFPSFFQLFFSPIKEKKMLSVELPDRLISGYRAHFHMADHGVVTINKREEFNASMLYYNYFNPITRQVVGPFALSRFTHHQNVIVRQNDQHVYIIAQTNFVAVHGNEIEIIHVCPISGKFTMVAKIANDYVLHAHVTDAGVLMYNLFNDDAAHEDRSLTIDMSEGVLQIKHVAGPLATRPLPGTIFRSFHHVARHHSGLDVHISAVYDHNLACVAYSNGTDETSFSYRLVAIPHQDPPELIYYGKLSKFRLIGDILYAGRFAHVVEKVGDCKYDDVFYFEFLYLNLIEKENTFSVFRYQSKVDPGISTNTIGTNERFSLLPNGMVCIFGSTHLHYIASPMVKLNVLCFYAACAKFNKCEDEKKFWNNYLLKSHGIDTSKTITERPLWNPDQTRKKQKLASE